jgi:hypothetical protein
MTPHRAPLISAIALVAVAGCSAAAPAHPAIPPNPAAAPTVEPTPVDPVPFETADPVADPTADPAAEPTAQPSAGGVTGGSLDFAVAHAGRGAIRATVKDPAAKSWRLVVAGTGSHAGDRWIIEVDTGDMGPVVAASETINGHEGEAIELAGLETGDVTGRVCATQLPVCLEASTFRLPEGDGRVAATLVATDVAARLTVAGGHAAWPGEPFILGPWTSAVAVPWQG